jgi:hypothetical protein
MNPFASLISFKLFVQPQEWTLIKKNPISYFLTPLYMFIFISPTSWASRVGPFHPNTLAFHSLIKFYVTTPRRGFFPPWENDSPPGPFECSTFPITSSSSNHSFKPCLFIPSLLWLPPAIFLQPSKPFKETFFGMEQR